MFYKIPDNLPAELDELDSYITRYQRRDIDAATLNVRRVPFGCYEQREDGTYMVRIRTTGGALTPLQLRAIAEMSARYGSDAIHITTRQDFRSITSLWKMCCWSCVSCCRLAWWRAEAAATRFAMCLSLRTRALASMKSSIQAPTLLR